MTASESRRTDPNLLDRLKQFASFLLLTNKSFRVFRWLGVYVLPVHYYTPIPDLRTLEKRHGFWERPSDLPGIDMRAVCQLALMQDVFHRYRAECAFPNEPGEDPSAYDTQNVYFGYVSAAAMHSMIRHHRPRRIIEVGAGYSTRAIARAAAMNAADGFPAQLMVIDPYQDARMLDGLAVTCRHVVMGVQDVDLGELTELQAHDILSIDTSHTVRTGGDVVFMYLELLPRLAPGVLVHIHDIFLPYEYPHLWLRQRRYWNEQYLLRALLTHSSAFRVVWGQRFAEARFPAVYAEIFSHRTGEEENHGSYSFWMERSRGAP